MTLTQMSEKYNLSRQAFYKAIEKGMLVAHMIDGKWCVFKKDYDAYRSFKYNRCKSLFNGTPLYRAEDKEISVRQCAKFFGVDEQHVYYCIKKGYIASEKRGIAYVLKYDDCLRVLHKPEEEKKV